MTQYIATSSYNNTNSSQGTRTKVLKLRLFITHTTLTVHKAHGTKSSNYVYL